MEIELHDKIDKSEDALSRYLFEKNTAWHRPTILDYFNGIQGTSKNRPRVRMNAAYQKMTKKRKSTDIEESKGCSFAVV